MVLYRDGQVVATRNDLPGTVMIANSSSMFQIGRNIDNGSRWEGLIDDVRFYNRPLNQAEIQDDFARIASSSLALKISQSGGNLDFEWNSTAGKRYDLLTNTELTTPIMDWPVLNDGETVHEAIPSAGVVTTLTGVPASGPRRFFALREYDAPPP